MNCGEPDRRANLRFGGSRISTPAPRHVTKTFDCVCDDDTLGRLFLTFDLQPDDSVIVKTKIRCYDSNKADTDDYDECELPPFTLAPGGHSHWNIYGDGENYAQAYFHVENTVDPS